MPKPRVTSEECCSACRPPVAVTAVAAAASTVSCAALGFTLCPSASPGTISHKVAGQVAMCVQQA